MMPARQTAPKSPARPRVLLIAPHTSYRTAAFLAAAERLSVDCLIASQGEHSIVSHIAGGLQVALDRPREALARIVEEDRRAPFAGIIATDDDTTELAADAAHALGLAHNPTSAVRLARRKDLARARLQSAGLPVPRHWLIDLRAPLAPQMARIGFPCVLKPLALSASRGVIRADDRRQFLAAAARIARLLAREAQGEERDHLLVESFVPGSEIAVEGLLQAGELRLLTIFDKPEPLDGPFFEETYYITPTRLDADRQETLRALLQDACRAYGLREGPVHAECRLNDDGFVILEIAARTIGGLCARLLRYGTGYGLEDLVILHALGRNPELVSEIGAGGVLMIPIARHGILRRVEGILAAQRIPYIEEIVIQVREGYELVPLPEGSSYLGFIFARGPNPAAVERALRDAHAQLKIVVAPILKSIAA